MIYMQKNKWDEAKVLIEETDLLIGMNPGSSLKHREILLSRPCVKDPRLRQKNFEGIRFGTQTLKCRLNILSRSLRSRALRQRKGRHEPPRRRGTGIQIF